MRLAALTLLIASGCLSVPEAKKPMCTSNDDCNTGAGEVCEEHVCYGNPPPGMFAATLSPPVERSDELVPLELPNLQLPSDGWLGDLAFEQPVIYSGRVEAYCTGPTDCTSRLSLDASITIARPSRFPGGAGFKTVVLSEGGITTGSSFRIALPPTHPGDPAYTVTIVPGGRNAPGTLTPTSAQLVAPLRMQLVADGTPANAIVLGAAKPVAIDGKLMAADGYPQPNYRVVALGRWDATAPLDEVSSVAFTDANGAYAITLADGLVGPVEVVASPMDGTTGPTLHLPAVDATKASTHLLAMPATLGTAKTLTVQINSDDGSGKIAPLDGAHVEVAAAASGSITVQTYVTARSEATTTNGLATVTVYAGGMFDGAYHLRVVPPAGANVGVIYDEPIALATDLTRQLDSRVALTGVATDPNGAPLAGVAVTAHPALQFAWNLDDSAQQFLSEIPPATTATDANGEYVLWVDHDLKSVAGAYDLTFEPAIASPGDSQSARWQVTDIILPTMVTAQVVVPPVAIPAAAFVHGRIADLDGLDVEGAELKIFRVDPGSAALCTHVVNAPASCPIPAILQGRGASDPMGAVRLTLPRP